jgi:hypothetical protein
MNPTKPINPKNKWFLVPDSLTDHESGKPEDRFYNVEARFRDHPILDVRASEIERHNVYKHGISCEQRVIKAAIGTPAIKNMTPKVLRFDKGAKLPRVDFEACVATIRRCWDAWQHYQAFRLAPVMPEEARAIALIERGPKPDEITMRDANGQLTKVIIDDGEEPEDDELDADEEAEAPEAAAPAANPAKPRAPAKKPATKKKAA